MKMQVAMIPLTKRDRSEIEGAIESVEEWVDDQLVGNPMTQHENEEDSCE